MNPITQLLIENESQAEKIKAAAIRGAAEAGFKINFYGNDVKFDEAGYNDQDAATAAALAEIKQI